MRVERRVRWFWGASAWILLLGAGAVSAQDTPTRIGPEEAVELALANHPMLRAAAAEQRAAEADRGLARSGYHPRIEISEDWARSTNPVFVFASKLGQERFTAADFGLSSLNEPDPFTNAATRLSVRQNIWDAGRTSLGKEASAAGIDAADRGRERTEDEVAFGALAAYWDQRVAEAMALVAADAEKAAQANLSLAAELVEGGLTVPSDRMSAEVRLAEVLAMRARADQGLAVARAALGRAVGLPGARFELAPPADDPAPSADTVERAIESALRNRPDLLALDARVRQAEFGERLARSHRLPELGAQAQYELNGNSPIDPDGSNWTVGVGIRYSLFSGSETRSRIERASADRERLEAMREAMRQGVELQVRAAWADLESAAMRLEFASSALDRSAEALRIVRERYGEGMAVMVELLAAEAAHTQARAAQVSTDGERRLARAALDLAIGTSKDGAR